VTGWLARDYPTNVAGIHLATSGLAVPVGDELFHVLEIDVHDLSTLEIRAER
jgi:hypothetical protein